MFIEAVRGNYNINLLLLPLIIGLIGGYCVLDIYTILRTRTTPYDWVWIFVGGIATGMTIWSVYLLCLLSYQFPFAVKYDFRIMGLSGLLVLFVCILGFYMVRATRTVELKLILGAVSVGLSLSFFDFLSIEMLHPTFSIHFIPYQVILATLPPILGAVALFAAATASVTASSFKQRLAFKLIGTCVIPLGIYAAYFSTLSATVFIPKLMNLSPDTSERYLETYINISVISLLVVFLPLIGSIFQQATNNKLKTTNQNLLDTQLKLTKSLAVIRATLESTPSGILVIDKHQKILDYNENFLRILKIPQAVIQLKDDKKTTEYILTQLNHPEQFVARNQEVYSKFDRYVHGIMEFKDGRIIEYFSVPQHLETETIGRVFSFRDITAEKKMEEQLLKHATLDGLTGLPNRVLLLDRLHQAIHSAQINNTLVALLYLDIDNFKIINDTLGRDTGDDMLKALAGRLKQHIRFSDTLARISGDEFAVLLAPLENIELAVTIAKRILQSAAAPFTLNAHEYNITASIGISLYPKDGMDAKTLLKNASFANHSIKEQGPGRFSFFTMELNINASNRMELENDLHQALARNEFFLEYQPIFSATSEKIIGTEALLRWRHPRRGVIYPLDFISIAEETGLILAIGDWVLHTACAQNKAWQQHGAAPIKVAVNLTAKQFSQQNFCEKVAVVLQKTGLDPKYLEVELTESAVLKSSEIIIRVISEIKHTGLHFVIDDFGTGYSNLNSLINFPIDKIKLDQSVVKTITKSSSGAAIATAMIAMIKSLHIISLAEGVETKEQFEFLQKNHCDEIQGFYFSKPISADACEKLIQKYEKNSS